MLYLHMYVCVLCVWYSQRTDKDIRYPGTGVRVMSSSVGAGNEIWIFWKSYTRSIASKPFLQTWNTYFVETWYNISIHTYSRFTQFSEMFFLNYD